MGVFRTFRSKCLFDHTKIRYGNVRIVKCFALGDVTDWRLWTTLSHASHDSSTSGNMRTMHVDTIAIGASANSPNIGIHAPDDVRLMGFDGIPFSACTNPPISTVAMDVPAMARTVIDRMVTLNESNLRHERPDDITHDHIQFQVMPHVDSVRLIPAGTLMSAGLHPENMKAMPRTARRDT